MFDRSRAGALLAPAGRDLLPLALDILERYELLGEAADTRKQSLAGTFRMGVSPTIRPNLAAEDSASPSYRISCAEVYIIEAVPNELERGLRNMALTSLLTVLSDARSLENKIRPLLPSKLKIVMAADHPLAKKASC